MDLLMPEVDGFAACQSIRKSHDNVPVIAMTASDDSAKKDEAFGVGMNDFITKPIRLEVIKQLLIKWFSEAID
jgi:CheY-like chemotaxis protein